MKLEVSIPEVLSHGGLQPKENTKLTIELVTTSLTIHPEGMGCYEGNFAPIVIERANGKIRLIYYPDINDQEPVIVDMSGALLSNSDLGLGNCPHLCSE